jgi:hypothetical protein
MTKSMPGLHLPAATVVDGATGLVGGAAVVVEGAAGLVGVSEVVVDGATGFVGVADVVVNGAAGLVEREGKHLAALGLVLLVAERRDVVDAVFSKRWKNILKITKGKK